MSHTEPSRRTPPNTCDGHTTCATAGTARGGGLFAPRCAAAGRPATTHSPRRRTPTRTATPRPTRAPVAQPAQRHAPRAAATRRGGHWAPRPSRPRELGVRCVGTASAHNFDTVRRFGGEPVTYGEGLADRLRAAAPGGYAAALDTVGTDEAVDVSLELVADRQRIVTIAAFPRAERDGIPTIGGMMPKSAAFRDEVRPRLVAMADDGRLVVPVARTFPLGAAPEELALLQSGHPGGKLALLP